MRWTLALVLACLLAAGIARAAEQPRTADHEALRALLQQVKDAVNGNDLDALAPLLAPGFVVTLVDQTVITDLLALKDYFRRNFTGDGALLEGIAIDPRASVLSQFIGERTALDYGESADTYTLRGGHKLLMHSRWTATLVKNGERWQIQALHAGVNMLDNPILRAAQHQAYAWGAGGFLAGALTLWLIGRWRRT